MRDIRGKNVIVGERVRIEEDIPSVDGMLYRNTLCKIDSFTNDKIRVQDRSGKLWWVSQNQISASFL
tara:strand:+ start:56 stop:256 length:201 start_codon:yes stop_codon:yes gene_type:complete